MPAQPGDGGSILLILAAAAMTCVTAMCAGRLLGRALRIDLDPFLAFVSGSAVLSTVVFLLTAAGLAYRGYFVALAVAITALPVAARWLPGPAARPDAPSIPRTWALLFWTVFLVFGLMYLSQALAPETSYDGAAYHVGTVARYFREHHFPRITTNFYANFPAGIEMLFLFAFSVGKHSAAAMVEFLFLLMTPFGILSWARRAGHPVAGVVGALLFFVAPVVGRDGTVAYVDVATAAIALALFAALQMWRERPSTRLLMLAGLIAGFGFSAKYTQAAGILYGAGFIVFQLRTRRKEILRSVAAFGLCACLVVAPWLAKNALFVHNPVSPFLNRVFPNPYVYPSFEADFLAGSRHFNGVTTAEIPLEATIGGERLSGFVGPLFLLAPLALLALRAAAGRQVLIAAAVYLVPYFGNISVRLLIPALLFLSLALAIAAERKPPWAAILVAIHAVTCWPAVAALYTQPFAWRIEGTSWDAALRRIPEREFLLERLPGYEVSEALRDTPPEGGRVLTGGSFYDSAYQPKELVGPYQSALGMRLADELNQVLSPDLQPTARLVFDFPERTVPGIRLAAVGGGDRLWAVSEMRVFLRQAETPPTPAWRFRSRPNPWEAKLAFDNRPITLWNTRQYRPSEAFLEIDFGSGLAVDRVTVDLPGGLPHPAMRIESETAPQRWAPIAASLHEEQAPYPADARRAVMEDLAANGIRWIVSRDDEPLAADLVRQRKQWGLAGIEYDGGYRLWQWAAARKSTIDVADPGDASHLLDGFYRVEPGAFRWTRKHFEVLLAVPACAGRHGARLAMRFLLPETEIQTLGSVTVSAASGSVSLGSERYGKPGDCLFQQDVPARLLGGQSIGVEFTLDKALSPSPSENRELGVAASRIGIEAKP